MKTSHSCIYQFLATSFLLAVTLQLRAQHYPAGSEGIKAGSLPAPGFYVEDYNSFYFFNHTPGFGGQLNLLEGFNYVQSPRLMWMTDLKILGADVGMAVRVPIAYKQITHRVTAATAGGGTGQIPGGSPGSYPGQTFPPLGSFPGQGGPLPGTSPFTETQFGLADIEIQPVLLSWHLKHFDFSAGYSFWAPTGDTDFKNRFFVDNLGAGYWTHSFMLGITWYPDAEKTWAVSVLNHYDINTAQYSSLVTVTVSPSHPLGIASEDTTLGDIYTLEWAVSKTVIKGVDVGLTGYYQQQVTDTEGPTFNGPTWQNERIHVAGIGPEVGVTLPKWGLSASLRYAYEFSAMDHPQGNLITLTIGKSF